MSFKYAGFVLKIPFTSSTKSLWQVSAYQLKVHKSHGERDIILNKNFHLMLYHTFSQPADITAHITFLGCQLVWKNGLFKVNPTVQDKQTFI